MAGVVESAMDFVNDFLNTYEDPRINCYPLMNSLLPTLAIVGAYILGVKYIGPKLMENRKPFELKKVLIWYNVIEITISVIALYETYVIGWFTEYSWKCQPVDRSDAPLSMRLVRGAWLYYISKIFELFDTVFFVMRKKNEQVSKLHVYHHSIMPINTWIMAKFVPGGQAVFGGVLNSFVHIIMYSYYLIAALGPSMRKYLWWKKYLTIVQMGQFVLVFIHSMLPLFYDCGFPRPFSYFTISQVAIFLVLFKNFYDNAYQNEKRKGTVTSGSKSHHVDTTGEKKTDLQKNQAARKRKPIAKAENVRR